MDKAQRKRLLGYLKELNQPEEEKELGLVDEILKKGDDPEFAVEPEDKFGNPKQLKTIVSLRKQGFDNSRIFKAMEIEAAEQESVKTQQPLPAQESPKAELLAEEDSIWDNLTKPLHAMFMGGTGKMTGGNLLRTLGTSTPKDKKIVHSNKAGYGIVQQEKVTREQALERTFDNPLFKQGSMMVASGLEDFANRPDLRQNNDIFDYSWYEPKFISKAIGGAVPSILQVMAPAIATTVITKNPVAGMAVAMSAGFGIETAGMMETALENGISPIDARNVAMTVGTINAMFTSIPAYSLFKKVGIGTKPINDLIIKGLISKGAFAKGVSKKAFVQGTTEVIEELLQESTNIIAEETQLGIESTVEEKIKRLQAAGIGGYAVGTTLGIGSAVTQQANETNVALVEDAVKEKQSIQTLAKEINDDAANDYKIEYDASNNGVQEISEDEIVASGYDIELNKLEVIREDENGNKFYAVKVKGETDSKGGIKLTSAADRSTVLEETVEFRIKQLQNEKGAEENQLLNKIKTWAKSVRKKASEMGYNVRFADTDEGNLELFSDAIVYGKGGFTGLSEDLSQAIYIPDDISNEFIQNMGKMSDGRDIFDMLKSEDGGLKTNQEFSQAVDEDIKSQMGKESKKTIPPPKSKPTAKSKLQKKTKQMVPGENTKTPAFQNWLGKSVLKDELFEPIVMYHGTNENFDEFMPMTYMSSSPEVGNFYARDHRGERQNPGTNDDGQVYPVYARIENPFDFHSDRIDLGEQFDFNEFIFEVNSKLKQDGKESLTEEQTQQIFDNFLGNNQLEEYTQGPSKFTPIETDEEILKSRTFNAFKFIDLNLSLADALESRGYDGIKANEFILEEENPKVYIAFEPNQIKSAFNQGTFDPNDGNISYQLEPAVIKKAVSLYPNIDKDTGKAGSKAERINRFLGRLTTRVTKENPIPKPIPLNKQAGSPKNKSARRVELKNGSIIYIGAEKTSDQWIEQVNSVLTQKEQETAANWYEEAYPTFVEHFGEEKAVPHMVAWLMGNVNASPQQALSNMFLGAEQLSSDLASFKSAGLPLAAKNVELLLSGFGTEVNAGAKLYDFLDSALGKTTRTVMKDDEKAGSAVADDRHTNRDIGFVDATLYDAMMRLGVDVNQVKGIRIDQKRTYKKVYDKKGRPVRNKDGTHKKKGSVPGPTETQYEWGVQKFNQLSRDINSSGYMGGKLKTWQHQAIGWTAIARAIETSDGMSIPDSFRSQKPTISFELAFGTGTPFRQKYGEAFDALPLNEKQKLTKEVTEELAKGIAKDIGLKVTSISGDAVGGWGDATNPSTSIGVMGSDQAIQGMIDSFGYCCEQDGIGRLKTVHGSDGLGFLYMSDAFADNAIVKRVWDILRKNTDDIYSPGFSFTMLNDPELGIENMATLMVGTKQTRSQTGKAMDQINNALEIIREELEIEVDCKGSNVQYKEFKNDWTDKKTSEGQGYSTSIRESFGINLQQRLDNHHKPRVEKRIQDALKRQANKERRTYQLVPDPDYAAEVDAAEKVNEGQTLDPSDTTISDHLLTSIFDKLHPVVKWQKDVVDQFLGDARIRDQHNVALAAELYVGKVSEKLVDFDKDILNINESSSFVRRLTDSDITIEDFNLYLHALHAAERNAHISDINEDMSDGGSGMTSNQARELKKSLNKKYGLKKIKAFAKEFHEKVTQPILELRYENGLIDEDSYNNLKSKYKNYVPLFRVMNDTEAVLDVGAKMSKAYQGPESFDVKGQEFFKAKGSKREVKNILVSAVEQYQSSIIRAEKNLVNQRLLNLTEAYPSEAYEVKGVQYKPQYNKDGEIQFMDERRVIKDSDGNQIPDNQVIHVKVDGKTKQIIFKGEYGARIAKSMRDMGTSKSIPYLNNFNNYLRYVNTIYNPEFMVTNFMRDIQTAGINISAEQGNTVLAQALSPKNLKDAWKGVYQVVQKKDTEGEWAEYYERLRKAGGKTGFFDVESIEDKLEKLEKRLKRVEEKGIGVIAAGKGIFDFVENLNEATESSIRLTLFKSMLDNGYTEEQAASGAKNVTINFNRKGEIGQFLNSLYLFANAGLQGSHRIVGVVKNNKSAQKAVAGLAAMGIAESLANHIASAEDDEYDKLSNYEKDNNFIIRYGNDGEYFKIRLPYGYNVFKVVGNIAGDMAWAGMNNKPVDPALHMSRFLEAVNSSFNPIGSGPIEQVLTPTVADPIIQLSTNKAFHGGPIVPESQYGPQKADIEKAWSKTPGVYKKMSQWLFLSFDGRIRYNPDGSIKHAVRGPGIFSGDISPETFEYGVDYLGGGLGKFLMRSVSTAQDVVNYESNLSKSPFIRQLYGNFDSKSESSTLYRYEKDMSRKIYDKIDSNKYMNYLDAYYRKGNLTSKEYRQRLKRFRKSQRKARRTYGK